MWVWLVIIAVVAIAVIASKGKLAPKVRCPHCGESGHISTKRVRVRKGVHGGKVLGGLLTGGLSLLGTGLSRFEWKTQAHCSNCGMTWNF